jgi:pSer/pThr/pTyr-binding forkhead associated (FHA) protein
MALPGSGRLHKGWRYYFRKKGGEAVSATDPDESSEAIPLATLTQYDTAEGVRTYTLQRGVTTLGRSNQNEIVLPNARISRQHCRIYWDRDRYVLEDLNSSNGTYLNQEQIQLAFLATGDTLQIGGWVLEFTLVS